MENSSTLLPLLEVLPGMRLADDLRDASGQVLLPRGSELTENILTALARRDIAVLPIVTATFVDEEALQARREASRRRLLHLFRHAGSPSSQALLKIMLEYRQEHPQ